MVDTSDISAILDDFVILSFIIQLSIKDMSLEQRHKLFVKITELQNVLSGGVV